MRFNFLNKFLIIFTIFILLSSFLVINKSYASVTSPDFVKVDGVEYKIPAGIYNYCIAKTYSIDKLVLLYSTDDTNFWKQYGVAPGFWTICRYSTENFTYATEFNYILIDLNETDFTTGVVQTRSSNYAILDDGIIYSSFDIYDVAGTKVFFQKAPVTVLEPILERTDLMTEIITTIVGLVKLLIPLLICLLGFWKAWHLLLRLLRKA